MTTFSEVHMGDKIRLDGTAPVRLVEEPHACDDPWCSALHCKALAMNGTWVTPVRAYPDTEIEVLDVGPVSRSASECPSRTADAVAEHVDKPTYRGGPALPGEIEAEYQRRKDDE